MSDRGIVDVDVHCAPSSIEALYPYLDEYWRSYIESAGVRLPPLTVAYPPQAPTTGAAVPASYEELPPELLGDESAANIVVLGCISAFEAHRHPYYAAALASAVNDWMAAEWLDRDDRLRGSIIVPANDIEGAVAELERVSQDPRFVQVLLPVRADAPYGNRRYHPLLEAAAARGLVVALHAWGRPASAPTPTGFTQTYMEDYLSNQVIVQNHVLSLVSEGAFERFPDLRITLLECGFAWLPALMWRFDKDWKGLWLEVPWVKEAPSAYVRRHFRMSVAPAHLPTDAAETRELLTMVGADMLVYASDFPHRHGPTLDALRAIADETELDAIRSENARSFYTLAAA